MNAPSRPLPEAAMPDELDRPFWEGCARGELLVHRCGACGRSYWPASCCVEHGGGDMSWVAASGRAVVDTYTIFHRQYHPAFPPPYVVAVVRLEEGPYFHANILECEPADVAVGMPVEVTFQEVAPGSWLPQFKPTRPAQESST